MPGLFHLLQKMPLPFKTALGYCLCCLIYFSMRYCFGLMRNRPVAGARSVELQQVSPAAPLSGCPTPDSDVDELSRVPSKVEVVIYRGDGDRGIDCEGCAICLGSFESGDECWVLQNCNHTYHKDCIEKWFRRCSNCPLCRGAILA